MFDLVVIGGGPAGLTSAIYACRGGLTTLIIEKFFPGGQLLKASTIENYPGFPDGIFAADLASNMHKQAEKFGTQFKYGEVSNLKVINSDSNERIFEITVNNEVIQAKTVIVAAGRQPRGLGIQNESQFVGKGISYCASCDGHFFKDKVVAVAGGGNTAISDAIYLSSLCKKVIIVHRRDEYRAEKVLVQNLSKLNNLEQILNARVIQIEGGDSIESITVEINEKSGTRIQKIDINGFFIAVGYIPITDFLKGIVDLDQFGYVVVDESMRTSVDGIFAAGDVINKRLSQIITAASDGATAANSVLKYLSK